MNVSVLSYFINQAHCVWPWQRSSPADTPHKQAWVIRVLIRRSALTAAKSIIRSLCSSEIKLIPQWKPRVFFTIIIWGGKFLLWQKFLFLRRWWTECTFAFGWLSALFKWVFKQKMCWSAQRHLHKWLLISCTMCLHSVFAHFHM